MNGSSFIAIATSEGIFPHYFEGTKVTLNQHIYSEYPFTLTLTPADERPIEIFSNLEIISQIPVSEFKSW